MQYNQKPLVIRLIHWLVFLLFTIAVVTGYWQADHGWSGTGFVNRGMVNAAHETSSILVVTFIAIWAIFRARSFTEIGPLNWFKRLLIFYHLLLTGLGLTIALLGWMGSSAGNYGQAVFGVVTVPNIIPVLGAEWAVFFNSMHKVLVPYFLVLFGIHAISALFHLLVLRDRAFYSIWFGNIPTSKKQEV